MIATPVINIPYLAMYSRYVFSSLKSFLTPVSASNALKKSIREGPVDCDYIMFVFLLLLFFNISSFSTFVYLKKWYVCQGSHERSTLLVGPTLRPNLENPPMSPLNHFMAALIVWLCIRSVNPWTAWAGSLDSL